MHSIRFGLAGLALTIFAFAAVTVSPSLFADGGAKHQVRNQHFGVSGGNVNDITRRFCCSGTLGSLVQDSSGVQYILSNNHVLGLSGSAHVGDDISQPGLIDNNCRVSTVVADFTGAAALGSNVDGAIAALKSGQMDATGFIEDIGVPASAVIAPAVGMSVDKSGRTTGFTTGTISSVNTSVSVQYQQSCGSGKKFVVSYTNQVVINSSTFSAGGDSGSLIVSSNCHNPVALLFAGSSTTTIGNPVGEVLAEVGAATGKSLSFVGGNCSGPTKKKTASAAQRSITPTGEAVDRALQAMRSREKDMMSQPGVIGVGVGAADVETDATIVVYVDINSTASARLPRRINGVRVQRVYTEPFVAY